MPPAQKQKAAHLRVEPQLANAAGRAPPLGCGWEAEGVTEDGFLHRVHLEGGRDTQTG